MTKINNKALEIIEYINKYLNEYLKNVKTTSKNTLKGYKDSLKIYLEYLELNGITTMKLNYDCFSIERIENWLVYLKEIRKNSNQTINLRLIGLKVFLEFLGKKDISLLYIYSSASTIEKRKAIKPKVKSVSKVGIQCFFDIINQKSKTGRRDLTMYVLMYNTAARLDEILSLRLCDLQLDVVNPYVTIIGKGNKMRTLYLLPKTVEYLKNYIQENHLNSNKNDFLFFSKIKGKQFKLTEQAIEKQVKKWAEIANNISSEVPINLHPHQFRHSAATHWLDDGMNIVQISYLLGHESLETTMIYLEITTAQKAKALETLPDLTTEKVWKTDFDKLTTLIK